MKFPIINTMVRAMRQPTVAVPQILWVPNLLGAQYGQLTVPWVPSGADWSVEAAGLNSELGIGKSVFGSGLDNANDLDLEKQSNNNSNWVVTGGAGAGVATGGAPWVLGAFGIKAEESAGLTTVTYNSSAGTPIALVNGWGIMDKTVIGARARAAISKQWVGQIHSLKLTDPLDGVVNGRDVVELDGVNQYGTVPTWTATNGTIEFYVLFSNPLDSSSQYIIDPRNGTTGGFVLKNNSNLIQYSQLALEIDDVPVISASFTPVPGVVYKFSIFPTTLSEWDSNTYIAARTAMDESLNGFISNLSLTDLDDSSNSRFYPMDTLELVDDLHPVEDQPELWDNDDVLLNGESEDLGDGIFRVFSSDGSFSDVRSGQPAVNTTTSYSGTLTIDSIAQIGSGIQIGSIGPVYTTIGVKVFTDIMFNTTDISAKRISGITDYQISNFSVKETTQGTWFNDPTLTARANNSLDLNFAIRSVEMPTETNIFDQNGNVVGAWNNLDGSDPYVPLLTE